MKEPLRELRLWKVGNNCLDYRYIAAGGIVVALDVFKCAYPDAKEPTFVSEEGIVHFWELQEGP